MTLPYEIAKRLKDAGFPQGKGAQYMTDPNPAEFVYFPGENEKEFEEWTAKYRAYAPTLEELIEACTDIYRLDFEHGQGEETCRASAGTAENHFTGYGRTPIEAVANLWLSLKETK